jgi:hypothetical protein
MVLATLNSWKYFILILILVNGCQSQTEEELTLSLKGETSEQLQKIMEQVEVNKINLQLTSMGSSCVLRYNLDGQKQFLSLFLTPPCHFILDHNGQVRRESYNLPEEVTVIIILGDKPPADPLTPVSMRNDCGSKWKGVLISKNGVQISPRVGEGLACAGVGLDSKEYWLFVYN